MGKLIISLLFGLAIGGLIAQKVIEHKDSERKIKFQEQSEFLKTLPVEDYTNDSRPLKEILK